MYGVLSDQLDSFAATTRLEFQVAGTKHIAANDGSIGMNFRGSASDSDRGSQVPIINLEVSSIQDMHFVSFAGLF